MACTEEYRYKQAVVNGTLLLIFQYYGHRGNIHVVRLKIRELAEQRGISRTKLSRLSDTNYKTIDLIWKNPYMDVKMQTLIRIAKALSVRVTDLIEEEDVNE